MGSIDAYTDEKRRARQQAIIGMIQSSVCIVRDFVAVRRREESRPRLVGCAPAVFPNEFHTRW